MLQQLSIQIFFIISIIINKEVGLNSIIVYFNNKHKAKEAKIINFPLLISERNVIIVDYSKASLIFSKN